MLSEGIPATAGGAVLGQVDGEVKPAVLLVLLGRSSPT
jgi:hypothetical protein